MKEQREERHWTTADMAGIDRRNDERAAAEAIAGREPGSMAATAVAEPPAARNDHAMPLFPTGECGRFRERWTSIQTGFVDEPRHAVEQADGLVAEMMQRLAQIFADERAKLEGQWSRGSDISTEDLRQALRRYRTFFDRLLSV